MVFEHLHTRVPTAQLYNFLTGPTGSDTRPTYALFTDPDPASALGDNNVPRSPLFEAIAVFWAGLVALIIVLKSPTFKSLTYQTSVDNNGTLLLTVTYSQEPVRSHTSVSSMQIPHWAQPKPDH